jgi:hypothetical protein
VEYKKNLRGSKWPADEQHLEIPNPSVAFLRSFHGDQPWHLVAIEPIPGKVKGKLHARTFTGANGVAEWIEECSGKGWGLYFYPNRLKGKPRTAHASKDEVAEAAWLYVDIDPPKNCEALETWRAKHAEITDLPPPTWRVDSGRGFWFFWKLAQPVAVDGKNGEQTKLVESYGKGIGGLVGGDDCHNIDRLARLPGTVNHRTGKRAAVLEHHPERVYSLADFPRSRVKRQIGANLANLIENGALVGQRSEAFHKAVCELKSLGYGVEEITELLAQRPRGIAAKFIDRLEQEVSRCFEKGESPLCGPLRPRDQRLFINIAPKDKTFLWWPYLPSGIVLLGAQGNVGKGLVASDITSRVTRGAEWPTSNERAPKGSVIWLEMEDELETTVIPRLLAAGADRKHIEGMNRNEFMTEVSPEYIKEHSVKLIVVSPLLSWINVKNLNDEIAVRDALEKLQAKIAGTDCVVLGIVHPNKKADLSALERILGSVAFKNYCRSVVLLNPEEEESLGRLTHAKWNLSTRGDDLLFHKYNTKADKPRGQYVAIEWEKAADKIDPETAFNRKKADEGTSAGAWLFRYLQENGETLTSVVFQEGEKYGYAEGALKRAKLRDGSLAHRSEGFPAKIYWRVK